MVSFTRRRPPFRALALSLALAVAGPTFMLPDECVAQPRKGSPDDDKKSKARELFQKGAEAVGAKKYEEGLAYLQNAEALFHAPTHLLWIGRAQAGMGRLFEARTTYERLRDETLPPKTSDAFVDAQNQGNKELEELLRRIPKIAIVVKPPDAKGLVVTMDGTPVPAERVTTEFGVEAGSYTFEAKADGLESGRVKVEAAERTTTEVKLVLQQIGKATEGVSGSTVSVSEGQAWGPMKIASVPLMAVGGAGLVVGGIMGALHFVRASEADDKYAECFTDCQDEVQALDDESVLFGNVAIGALAGGAAVLATGIILFAVAPSAPADETAVSVRVGPTGVDVRGRF